MVKYFKSLKIGTLVIVGVMMTSPVLAAMQSTSYVIYENINHAFDGPVISGISHSVAESGVTVTWNTDVVADGFVEYSTDVGFATSKEQGSSVKNSTSHSVVLTGLTASTLYYYRVNSTRVNGGIATESGTSFTTAADSTTETPTSSGGGGMLIIDKTDKNVPIITDVSVKIISSESVTVSWKTDEESTSFVEYGSSSEYGRTYGEWNSVLEHSVTLINLEAEMTYHLRAISSDDWGNVGYSEDIVFTTEKGVLDEEEIEELEEEDEQAKKESILEEATNKLLEYIRKLFPEVSLSDIGRDELLNINSLDELSGFVPAPILSGEPRIEVGATEATIIWTTDVESNSLVAIASEDKYVEGANEPYMQVVGDADIAATEHEVKIYNLSPDTTYHYQLRSKASLGPVAKSKDFVFKTSIEEIKITSVVKQIVDNENVIFKWVTNKESDSAAKFAPYQGNVLAIDQSKTIKDNNKSVIHEVRVTEFEAGVYYDVELVSADEEGNTATELIQRFSTSEDDLPPEVSRIKAESTIFVDQNDKSQTVISWGTNEPATSQVYYQEGVHGANVDLSGQTDIDSNYVKNHVVVITKFEPGTVYSFRVKSIDSGGNETLSNVHTFMTAKKKESIIQVIIGILENTFGWVKKLM